MARTVSEWSAGGLLLVRLGQALLVPLIELRRGKVLGLPKGRVEAGESVEQAACRETREETGMEGRVLTPLGDISYSFYSRSYGARVSKRVDFFLLSYRWGSPARHNDEVEGVRLAPLECVHDLLTYAGERRVALRAQRAVAAGALLRATNDYPGRGSGAHGPDVAPALPAHG